MVECFYKFTDLFRVAQFVVTDRAEPVVHVQAAQEGMLVMIKTDIGAARGFDKCHGCFAGREQSRQRFLLVADALGIQRNRRAHFASTPSGDCQWQVETLAQRQRLGRRAQQPFHAENRGFFDDRDVRDHFGGGPAVRRRRFAPAEIADFFSCGQEFGARVFQVPEDRSQVFQMRISSNREATGLFERTSKLQDAAFAEVAGEYLHSDGQSRGRHSAGN